MVRIVSLFHVLSRESLFKEIEEERFVREKRFDWLAFDNEQC